MSAAISEGHLLGGRLRYSQPAHGYRTGLEPVLLAASLSARPGDRVVEAGTGAGAGLLCLMARVAGLQVIGIERDAELAELARANLAANGFATACVLTTPLELVDVAALGGAADHCFANPPWHDAAGTPSPVPGRAAAKRAAPGLIELWAARLAHLLRPGGTLSLMLPATQVDVGMLAMRDAALGGIAVCPFWPRADRGARLVLLRGEKDGRGAASIRRGLVLHEATGFTDAADRVLRAGESLDW